MPPVVSLIVLCVAFVTAFLYSEIKDRYVAADVLKGLASACFVAIGVLRPVGNCAVLYKRHHPYHQQLWPQIQCTS